MNADAERETEVRLLWTPETFVFEVCGEVPEHHRLSGRGCARVAGSFVGPRCLRGVFAERSGAVAGYKEFEVAPNGFWIDLDIAPGEKRDLRSGLRRRVEIDEARKSWRAVLDLPMKSLTARFDAGATWRVNFFPGGGRRRSRGFIRLGSRRGRRSRIFMCRRRLGGWFLRVAT